MNQRILRTFCFYFVFFFKIKKPLRTPLWKKNILSLIDKRKKNNNNKTKIKRITNISILIPATQNQNVKQISIMIPPHRRRPPFSDVNIPIFILQFSLLFLFPLPPPSPSPVPLVLLSSIIFPSPSPSPSPCSYSRRRLRPA